MKQRKANRLKGFDYSNSGKYFITSNVAGNISCLGEFRVDGLFLNDFGRIVVEQWEWLNTQYPYIVTHAFVVMPNHIHALLEIKSDVALSSLHKIKSISELIGAFKSTSSKRIHLAGFKNFAWHRSFHDHIVRDDSEFAGIKKYIENNPSKWLKDKFRPQK